MRQGSDDFTGTKSATFMRNFSAAGIPSDNLTRIGDQARTAGALPGPSDKALSVITQILSAPSPEAGIHKSNPNFRF
jgi:hypothetical protein